MQTQTKVREEEHLSYIRQAIEEASDYVNDKERDFYENKLYNEYIKDLVGEDKTSEDEDWYFKYDLMYDFIMHNAKGVRDIKYYEDVVVRYKDHYILLDAYITTEGIVRVIHGTSETDRAISYDDIIKAYER